MVAQNLIKELKKYSSPERKKNNGWFFKTGPGQYGEGDKFIGVRVPDIRQVARQFLDLDFTEGVLNEYQQRNIMNFTQHAEGGNIFRYRGVVQDEGGKKGKKVCYFKNLRPEEVLEEVRDITYTFKGKGKIRIYMGVEQ